MKVILAVLFFTLSFILSAQASGNIERENKPIYVDNNKFLNALSKATYHIDQGRMAMAQLWLRVAYEHAPDAEAKGNVQKLKGK